MFVAVVGAVVVVPVIGTLKKPDDDDYSDHRHYSDSSMRNEVARLEQEVQDMERKILRIRDADTEEIRESYASLSDSIDKTGALPQEILDCFDSVDRSNPSPQTFRRVSGALTRLVNKEQERLKAIDQTIARINEIELESGDEGKQ
ncbi:MAG: hypothetical protein VZR11_07055 [Succinimonas sp.]|nr:hypothetical protein [Succinimonas sp.]